MEGERLRQFLKENKINQEDLAQSMGMTRHGLMYHFNKPVIDYEFKMKLRKHGVSLFDENGKIVLTEVNSISTSGNIAPPETSDLKEKYIKLLEEAVVLLKMDNQKLMAEVGELKKKLELKGSR